MAIGREDVSHLEFLRCVLGFRVEGSGLGIGSTWGFAGKAAAPPCRPFLFMSLSLGRHRSSQAQPQPPYATLPLHASILFGVGMGVRRQIRSPPMPPFLCLAGSTQKIAGKAAAPLRRPSFVSQSDVAFRRCCI